jgi:serine protease inhibitor
MRFYHNHMTNISGATAFALALHLAVAKGENVMTSPYSLRQALGIALAGSAGETRAEMARVLSAGPAFEAEEKALRLSLEAAKGEATLKIANAVLLKKGYEFRPSFLKTAREAFGAEVFERDFDPAALKELNGWVSSTTNGRIPRILDSLEPGDRALIVNAVYFKGKWAAAFPAKKPYPATFTPGKGKPFPIKLMSIKRKFDYAETPGWQAVRLPYKGGRLAMLVVLPAASSSLAAFHRKLDELIWNGLRRKLEPREGLVAIPRFTFSRTYELKEPLQELGMGFPFDPSRADFSGMAEGARGNLYVSKVVQKTFIAVDEEGTEASAATGAGMSLTSLDPDRPKPFRFIADRPFLFAIEDVRDGTILFLGEVQDPR